MSFDKEQKLGLFLEFGIGVPMNIILALALYYYLLPDYTGMENLLNRIVFTLQCNILPAFSMLLGLFAVAFLRGTSKSNAPLSGTESPSLQIHMRYLTNTHEQMILFFISSLALSPFLNEETIKIIPAAAIMFFLNRILFWVGYLKNPIYRGLGLSGTLYPVSFMLLYAVYLVVTDILF